MSIMAKNEGKTFELVPQGTHVARIYQIVHIGTIPTNFTNDDGSTKYADTVRLTWELPLETKEFKEGEGERPFVISQEYTLSMNEKANLRKVVEGVIGTSLYDEEAEGFDVQELMGKVSFINIQHKRSKAGRDYAVVASATPLPKGQEAPAQVNESYVFDYETATLADVEKLPQFVREKMENSKEYQEKFGVADINPDDIPF